MIDIKLPESILSGSKEERIRYIYREYAKEMLTLEEAILSCKDSTEIGEFFMVLIKNRRVCEKKFNAVVLSLKEKGLITL